MEAPEVLPKSLLVAVLGATLAVLVLGGAVVAVKLRTAPAPPGSQQAAVDAWEKQVAANPKNDGAQTGLGAALLEAGQTSAAQKAFETAVSLNPKNWFASFQLGVLLQASDPTRAEQLLSTAGPLAPAGQKVGPYDALGDLRLSQKDYAGAEQAYRRAAADNSIMIDPHVGLAQAYAGQGEKQKAIAEYQTALKYDPSNQAIKAALNALEGKS